MKLSSKLLTLILTLTVVFACKNNTDKKGNEDTVEKVEQTEKTSEKKKTPVTKEVKKTKTEIAEDKFSKYIVAEMKDYTSLPVDLWLTSDFITKYNESYDIDQKISYQKNTSIKGDFNGDGFKDRASVMMDNKNIPHLFVFHQTEEGYKKFEIPTTQTALTTCCLGYGISVTPPGMYTDRETKNERTVKSDGIIYSIYEKSQSLWFFDGKKYQAFFISD